MDYSYDRRTPELRKQARSLGLGSVKPLYGHTSESTAYVVDDYPYGRDRTQIRFWLEDGGKKGWRFVSQTLNPKTQRWNKPKKSTYSDWGGAMYLDSQNHVKWAGVGRYSDIEAFEEFVQKFPKADMRMLKKVTEAKIKHLSGMISGEKFMTINGEKAPVSELDLKRWQDELDRWKKLQPMIR